MLMDDRPGLDQVRLHNLDAHLLSTYSMLVALEQERLLDSAEKVWASIEQSLLTVDRIQVDESVRGDTEYRSFLSMRG